MCGIFAAIGRTLPDSALQTVLQLLDHRGPDGMGSYVDAPAEVTIAHTRLAVIDLQTGAQPLYSEDGNVVLACNGEIYDFERIRNGLEAKGHRFATRSDSEVILCLYEEYGLDCFDYLRGEFAFLLYDRRRRLFVAARDRFGIKPLYFSRLAPGFVFASEMKAIFASGLVAPRLDAAGLDPLLAHDPEKMRFPFADIEHVPPASYLTVDLDTYESSLTRYWSPEIPAITAQPVAEPFGDDSQAAARQVLRELEEAVRLRLRADVPVGLYLSGGLDSAFIGALMARNLDSRLHSFSISFAGSDRDEREFARQSAAFIDTEHHELTVTKDMLWGNLERCLWSTELPFATLAPVGKFLLSAEARKRVTVVLNGQGADEVFLGYRSFFQKALRDTRQPGSTGGDVRRRRLKVSGLTQRLSLLLFHKRHRRALALARAGAAAPPNPLKPLVNQVQEARIAEMPVDILGYLGDRVEMAHSLEVRVPFLDHKLYDAAKWIPDDFKLRAGTEKAVLRDAALGILPDAIRLRKKQGFMLTSDNVDLFGADRIATTKLREHLSRDAFERSGVFSYRAYLLISLVARLPRWSRSLRGLRRQSNKLILYMMQVHMLHHLYVAGPSWLKPRQPPASSRGAACGAMR